MLPFSQMHDTRFFQSTRGKIALALRRRHSASAVDLAEEFGLSPNAVRQQLLSLQSDGFVEERSVRRGPTKPTLEFSLTEAAEALFPQRYDKMLNAVLREVRESYGQDGLDSVLAKLSDKAAESFRKKLNAPDTKGRVYELAELLRENGVEADVVVNAAGTIELREHNCPYGQTVGEHPEVCTIIHTVLRETVSHDTVQVESIATGGDTCRFEIPTGAAKAVATTGASRT
jgi:predicted ArsR family transcriptional regulator